MNTFAERARLLLARQPLFDAHVDSIGFAVDLGVDLAERQPQGQLDLVRAREGGLGSVVFVAWPDPALFAGNTRERALAMFAATHELAERAPERVRVVRDGDELERAHADGVIGAILGLEGGRALGESLDTLAEFHARGLRVLTLVWNDHLAWARSCQPCDDPAVPAGLSGLGRAVVARANELGILVDLSHAGERTFYDALETSAKPAVASHSGCRALHDHPRNLTDDQLRALAANDGVVGIVFHPGFLDADARAEEFRVRRLEAYLSIDPATPARAFVEMQRILQRDAAPFPLERVVDHVLHAIEIAGPRHVGIGSDFDGIERAPRGLEDASLYPNLVEALFEQGLDEETIAGIVGGNFERVFRAATNGSHT
ncbi:MAG: dipeptidase [Planctomycetota bacterium]